MSDRIRFEQEMALLTASPPAAVEDREREVSAAQKECRKRWDEFRKTLPESARKALDALDFEFAVAAAVHHGLRDINKLTDMVFYAKYGQVHGYCPIKKGTRIPGGGDLYSTQWIQLRDTFVLPALARPIPPVAQQGGVVCTVRAVKKAQPQADQPPIDLTGRYEYTQGAPAEHFVFRINQAGRHVEGFQVNVLYPNDARAGRDLWFLHGDLQKDGSCTLFSRKNPKLFWKIVPSGNQLRIEGMGKTSPLTAVSDAPTLMEQALRHLGAADLIRRSEWFPLTKPQIEHLVASLQPDKINPLLKNFFDQDGGDTVAERNYRYAAADRFDTYIQKVFDDPRRGIHRHDLVLATHYARALLSRSRWRLGYTRSHLDWIQFMVSRIARDGRDLPYLPKYLGLAADPALAVGRNTALHKYRVTLSLKGVGFLVHYWRGTITVEKIGGDNQWSKPERYNVWLLAVESGMTLKLGDSLTAEGETSFDWKPPDFPGRISMAKAEAGVAVGPVKGAAQAGFLHIYGRGHLPPLAVYFKQLFDVSQEVAFDKKEGKRLPRPKGIDVSVGPGGAWGNIGDKSFPDVDYASDPEQTDYTVAYAMQGDVHFCLDSALLTEPARQALRIVCANELPAFMSSTSSLTIEGHTDRSDPKRDRPRKEAEREKYNNVLSELRAQNVLQAIKDILGARFAIPSTKIRIVGRGESEAKKDGRPDGEVNPHYRRVDVFLNTRLILRLRAQ